jgi:hypothetical protein
LSPASRQAIGDRLWPLAAVVLLVGCYNPKIGEGAFVCGPGGSCPSGFSCQEGRCYKGTATIGDGGADSPGTDGPAGCVGPLPCTPPPTPVTGQCDPVCQTGCACNQRCTNPGSGNVCQGAGGANRMLYESCDPSRDACRPGAVCLPEFQDRCGAHCYRFCRIDSDCPAMSRCKGEAHDEQNNLLYKVCSPRIEGCDPTGSNPRCELAGNAERPWPAFACYMLSVDAPESSVCECAGTLPEGAECDREYSCVPGSECVPVGSEKPRCRRLCTVSGIVVNPVACPAGQTCTAFPGARRLGYCLSL